MAKEYLLVNGKVKLSNTQLILNNSFVTVIKEKFAPLIITLLLSTKIYDLIQKISDDAKIAHWIFLIIFSLFLLICLYWLYNSWIKIPWKQKLTIQNIYQIEKEIDESETKLFLSLNNGKKVLLDFRTNEPYLEEFLKDLAHKTNYKISDL